MSFLLLLERGGEAGGDEASGSDPRTSIGLCSCVRVCHVTHSVTGTLAVYQYAARAAGFLVAHHA